MAIIQHSIRFRAPASATPRWLGRHSSGRSASDGGAAGVADRLRKEVEHGGGKGSPPDWQQKSHQSFGSFLKEACSRPELVLQLCHAFVGFLYSAVVDNELAPDWRTALMLLAAIFIPALCNFALSYWFKQRKVVLVKRRGSLSYSEVPCHQVRVRDTVHLRSGDQVPADGLCVRGALQVDESLVEWSAQESDHVHNSEPCLYAGSIVTNGSGEMLVQARRCSGDYDGPVSQVEQKISFQDRLNGYSIRWSRCARLMVSIFFTVPYLLKVYKPGRRPLSTLARDFRNFFNLALSMLVVAVPGGLHVSLPLIQRCFKSQMIVAKSAACHRLAFVSSDLRMTCNNGFASVVEAVGWGRTKRLLVFQGKASVVILVLNFLAGIAGEDVPFDALKLMWVILIVNTFGPLALSMEPLDDEVMKRNPPRRHDQPLTPAMFRDMLGVGGCQVPLLLVVVNTMVTFKGSAVQQVSQKNMFVFNAFVVGLMVNLLSAETPGRLNTFFRFPKSWFFLMVVSFIAICQVLMVQFGEAHIRGLDLSQWLGSVLIGVLNLPIAAAFKYFVPMDADHQMTTEESMMDDMAEDMASMPLFPV